MTTNGDDEAAARTDEDLENFENQPPEHKELQRLKDISEKSAGRKKADCDREIRRRSGTEQN